MATALRAWRERLERGGTQRPAVPVARAWEEAKREVARVCREATRRAHKKELAEYHRAVAGFLRAHVNLNAGRPFDAGKLRRHSATVQEFLRVKREQRRQRERCRARGPLLEAADWEGGRLGARPPRRLDGLRPRPGEEPDRSIEGMLETIRSHFQALFGGAGEGQEESQRRAKAIDAYVGRVRRKVRLEPAEEADMLGPITEAEVRRAIGQGKATSAPGPDGLGIDFYRAFADLLAGPLASAFTEVLEGRGALGEEAYGGRLHLIYKDVGDPCLLANWRPINIANVDLRLLARVLHNRLAPLASRLLYEGQTSAAPGRRMADSLRLARSVIDKVRAGEWGGWWVAMDQSKAFDRVNRPYLWAVMRQKGVPAGFVAWLEALYARAHVTPQLEGICGEAVRQTQGLRQGCPLSPLLYALALDPLLERVEADPRLAGVPLGGKRVVSVAHADDATFFLSDSEDEFKVLKEHLRDYAEASGAAVNHSKSAAYRMPRGGRAATMQVASLQRRGEEEEEADSGEGDRRVERVRLLGVWFGVADGAWQHNWRLWRDAALANIARWRKWAGLSMYQRAAYVNTYVLPGATFLAGVYPPPQGMLEEVTTAAFKFLWGTAHFPLARAQAYVARESGGLGLRALGPWLAAVYAAANFAGWWRAREAQSQQQEEAEERVSALWEDFGATWAGSGWARRWWWEEDQQPYRLTAALTISLPDHLQEAARLLRGVRLKAALCKGGGAEGRQEGPEASQAERAVRGRLYADLVEGMEEEARQRRRERHVQAGRAGAQEGFSGYRLSREAAEKAFRKPGRGKAVGNSIPYDLWELRWRAFHQVLGGVGAGQPWLQSPHCPYCQRRATRNVPVDTTAHFVAECPAAKQLWQAVARRLGWPALARQRWETVVSGLRPAELQALAAAEREEQEEDQQQAGQPQQQEDQQAGQQQHQQAGQPQQQQQQQQGAQGQAGADAAECGPLRGRRVPWALVQLTNLLVLRALGLRRAKEAEQEGNADVPAGPWADYVRGRLRDSAEWERRQGGKGDVERWQEKWGWLDTPIT